MTGKTFVYDETYPVEIVRDGIKMTVPFREIKKGDKVPTRNPDHPIIVGENAHLSGDAAYDGWLFYDTNGNSYFPEDFVKEPGLNVALCDNDIIVVVRGGMVTDVLVSPKLKQCAVTILDTDIQGDSEALDRVEADVMACAAAVSKGKLSAIY